MSVELIPIVITTGLFVMIGFIVKTVADNNRRRDHLKHVTEFHNRLLDKLGSVSDFAQFLQTEGGSRLLDSLSSERGSTGPRDRILRAVQSGIILTILGLGLGVIGWWLPYDRGGVAVLGGITLSLGVGLLVSSVVSYRLAKALGVLEADAGRARGE
jgi:hypothetical protein